MAVETEFPRCEKRLRHGAAASSIGIAVVLSGALAAACAAAAYRQVDGLATPSKSTFVRFLAEGDDGGKLQTTVTSYRNDEGVLVDLIGAVHIADVGYYQELQRRFDTYDALLYELVAPENFVPRPNSKGGGLITMFQRMLKRGLGLDFQLDALDYGRANFVHADMDPDTFKRIQDERGESLIGMMFRAWWESMKREWSGQSVGPTPEQIAKAFAGSDFSRAMKLLFAQQLQDMESLLAGLEGPDGESVIVDERNKVAMRVLARELARGYQRLGVFYGAAHLPDMEERLLAFGFKKTGEVWLTAWDIPPATAAAAAPAAAAPRVPAAREEDL